jgi:hypothetical protein
MQMDRVREHVLHHLRRNKLFFFHVKKGGKRIIRLLVKSGYCDTLNRLLIIFNAPGGITLKQAFQASLAAVGIVTVTLHPITL